jgi:hypothetical protein
MADIDLELMQANGPFLVADHDGLLLRNSHLHQAEETVGLTVTSASSS